MSEVEPPQPEQPDQLFDLADVDHEIVKKFQPKYLDKGGEHIVYDVPEHPNIVVKANTESIRRVAQTNINTGVSLDHMNDRAQRMATTYLATQAEQFKTLRNYFGREHVLNQRTSFLKVPTTPKIMQEIMKRPIEEVPNEAWALVTVQKRSEALANPDRVSISGGYAENYPVDPEVYQRQTQELFINPEGNEFNQADFLAVQQAKQFRELFEKLQFNEAGLTVLRDFVKKAIKYTAETGEILDLAGQDNVLLYQKDDQWQYELLDAFYARQNMIFRTTEAIRKLAEDQPLTRSERLDLLNTINYTRTINGLAKFLQIEERIRVVPSELQNAEIDYLEALKPAFSPNEP